MCRTQASGMLVVATLALARGVVLAPTTLGAQATTITLQGVVTAPDGSIPPDAQVQVRNRGTGAVRQTRTSASGGYRVLGLTSGTYDVSVRAIGYRQQRAEAARLVVGQSATLDFTLEPGPVELEPVVVAAELVFDVQRTDVSTAVLQEEIEKLPLNSRNVLNLAALAPGIRSYGAEGGRSVPAAGALPTVQPRFANFYVDGVEWKNMYVGMVVGLPETGSLIPQEAVREFRVYLNPYDPEYARGAAYIISAVTHQGGRALEGSLFSYVQNAALVQRNTFQSEATDYARYQVGGNVRGPLVKDRLFYALSYEGQLTDNFINVVPAKPAADTTRWDQYAGTFKAPHRLHTGLLRLTAPLRSHTVDLIWATRHLRQESFFGDQVQGRLLTRDAGLRGAVTVNSLLLRDTYAAGAVANEFSIHMLDFTNDQTPLVPGPAFLYPTLQNGRLNFPFAVHDLHLRAINKTAYTVRGAGEHALKAGVEVSRVRTDVYRPNQKDGAFNFSTDTSTLPVRGSIGFGTLDPTTTREARGAITGWLVGGYLQDQWQPVPSLTVTAGLRYDAEINTLNQNLETPWASDTTLERAFGEQFLNTGDRENDLDNLAPRLALSWDALGTGRTFARAGYGVMYDRVPLVGALDEAMQIGWRIYVVQNPGTTDPDSLRKLAASSAPPNITLLKDRLGTPATYQWSLGVGHRLSDRVALNLDYLHQRVRHAYVTTIANRAPPSGPRPITGRFGDIVVWDDFGDARSQALLASLAYDRAPARLSVAYTLAWAESEFGGLTTSDYPDSAAYAMQRSEGDERHRLVVSGFTRVPFGLDLSAMAILASPRPFFVTTGTDSNQNGFTSDDWPNGVRTLQRDGWAHWYRTIDLRLAKSFLQRNSRFVVTAEVFNVFGWASHSEYRSTQSSTDYAEPIGDYARRQAQLGVRYEF